MSFLWIQMIDLSIFIRVDWSRAMEISLTVISKEHNINECMVDDRYECTAFIRIILVKILWSVLDILVRLLTHWGRVTHKCVGKLTSIGSDNDLSPDRRQAIIWNNAGLLLIGPLGTKFSEILIKILTFSFTKMCLKVSSAKRRPFCLGPNVLIRVIACQNMLPHKSCNVNMIEHNV